MGIFSRIGTLVKANINDLISKAEDPEKILNQLIEDMRDQLISAKKEVAVAIADEKRLKKKYENEQENAQEWEKKAKMAVRAGRDDLAKEALERKKEHDELASEYKQQWQAQKQAAEKLRSSLRQLNDKIEEAKRKKGVLVARKKRAEAQKRIQDTMSGLDDTAAFDKFDEMEEKVEQMEAEAEASSELAGELSGDSLSNEFEELEEEHGSDQALDALKAKMGVEEEVEEEETEFAFEEELEKQSATEESEEEEEETVGAEADKRGSWDEEL
ncbi:MAG: PspA/IM30 family protein [Bradymonadaceae bacterium]